MDAKLREIEEMLKKYSQKKVYIKRCSKPDEKTVTEVNWMDDAISHTKAQICEVIFFSDLTLEQAADELHVSYRTARRYKREILIQLSVAMFGE